MSAYVHAALSHRLSVPAWLIAVAIAATIAIGAIALLDGVSDTTARPAAGSQPTETTLQPGTSCINNRVVGHC
jgi:hypothetical protein